MLDKDKLFLVVYIGVKNIPDTDIADYVRAFKRTWNPDESVQIIFIPTRENKTTKVECINPVLLDEEKYKEVEEKIEKITTILNNLENEGKN